MQLFGAWFEMTGTGVGYPARFLHFGVSALVAECVVIAILTFAF